MVILVDQFYTAQLSLTLKIISPSNDSLTISVGAASSISEAAALIDRDSWI
jgi:predicted transcriptional regulator